MFIIDIHKVCVLQTEGNHRLFVFLFFAYVAVWQQYARIIGIQTRPEENVLAAGNPCYSTLQVLLKKSEPRRTVQSVAGVVL